MAPSPSSPSASNGKLQLKQHLQQEHNSELYLKAALCKPDHKTGMMISSTKPVESAQDLAEDEYYHDHGGGRSSCNSSTMTEGEYQEYQLYQYNNSLSLRSGQLSDLPGELRDVAHGCFSSILKRPFKALCSRVGRRWRLGEKKYYSLYKYLHLSPEHPHLSQQPAERGCPSLPRPPPDRSAGRTSQALRLGDAKPARAISRLGSLAAVDDQHQTADELPLTGPLDIHTLTSSPKLSKDAANEHARGERSSPLPKVMNHAQPNHITALSKVSDAPLIDHVIDPIPTFAKDSHSTKELGYFIAKEPKVDTIDTKSPIVIAIKEATHDSKEARLNGDGHKDDFLITIHGLAQKIPSGTFVSPHEAANKDSKLNHVSSHGKLFEETHLISFDGDIFPPQPIEARSIPSSRPPMPLIPQTIEAKLIPNPTRPHMPLIPQNALMTNGLPSFEHEPEKTIKVDKSMRNSLSLLANHVFSTRTQSYKGNLATIKCPLLFKASPLATMENTLSIQESLMSLIVGRQFEDLADMEEFLQCYTRLYSPCFVNIVNQFFEEVCKDIFECEGNLQQRVL